MPNCLIIYFSQAGSTEKVAQAIATGLRSGGYKVGLHIHTVRITLPDITSYEIIGIGSPVYNFSQPFNVVDLVRSLSGLENKFVFLFNTYGTYSFDAGIQFVHLVQTKKANVLGYFACRSWDSYLGYAKVGWLFSGSHPDQIDLTDAETFGRDIAASFPNRPLCEGNISAISTPLVYRLERFFTNRWLTAYIYSRFFKVNKKICKRCGTCVRKCPVANIDLDYSGFPIWRYHCIGCLVCELRCPQNAIRSPLPDWLIFRPFLRHNVGVALKDDILEGRKARHFKGNIEVI